MFGEHPNLFWVGIYGLTKPKFCHDKLKYDKIFQIPTQENIPIKVIIYAIIRYEKNPIKEFKIVVQFTIFNK